MYQCNFIDTEIDSMLKEFSHATNNYAKEVRCSRSAAIEQRRRQQINCLYILGNAKGRFSKGILFVRRSSNHQCGTSLLQQKCKYQMMVQGV
jgi:hypothetical protein